MPEPGCNPCRQSRETPPHPSASPAVVDATELLGGAREIRLRLHLEEYRLRLTRNNKLILTK